MLIHGPAQYPLVTGTSAEAIATGIVTRCRKCEEQDGCAIKIVAHEQAAVLI